MDKVRLKLEYTHYATIAKFLHDVSGVKGRKTSDIISNCALKELHRVFLDVVYKNYNAGNRKVIKKEIIDSHALNFFFLFYGQQYDTYAKVAIKEVCSQIEDQLFITGKYEFPDHKQI